MNITGAASPQAVKKLLALSEQTKPRHKSHPGLERDQQSPAHPKADRVEQPTPVNLTSESSSVSGRPKDGHVTKTKVRKVQNSIGSITSTDSGFGPEKERLERNQSESPQLQNRRRYHQHYHRQQHNHGKYTICVVQTNHSLLYILYSPYTAYDKTCFVTYPAGIRTNPILGRQRFSDRTLLSRTKKN